MVARILISKSGAVLFQIPRVKVDMTNGRKLVIAGAAAAIAFAIVMNVLHAFHAHWSLFLLAAIIIFPAFYFYKSHLDRPRAAKKP